MDVAVVVVVLLLAVGVLFVADRAGKRTCPACKSQVPKSATKCRNCGEALAS
jgi:predicted amidophosphoribosyltransferase